MDTFLQLTVSGLSLGAIYALTALGFVIIYRASQVFNFAQGELLLFGAYMMTTMDNIGLPFGLALLMSMAITGVLAAVVERVALRPLVGRPVFITIIVTIFIGLILHSMIQILWDAEERGISTPWDRLATTEIFGAIITYNSIAAIIAGAITLALFFLLIKKTKLGIAMRATANDQEVSLALGIPVGRILGATWFISGACAAMAGVFLSMFPSNVAMEQSYIALRAFPAVIVGGLDSPSGTVIAGVMLGLAEMMAQGYLNPIMGEFGQNFHEVFPYIFMIFFLMIRPYGIFGSKEVERV